MYFKYRGLKLEMPDRYPIRKRKHFFTAECMVFRIPGKKLPIHFFGKLDVLRFQHEIVRHIAHHHDIKHDGRTADRIKVDKVDLSIRTLKQISSMQIPVTIPARKILHLLP